jgi:hypothetical protein
VLAELDTESFDLWARTRHFVGERLGAWYLVLLLPAFLLVVDTIVQAVRRQAPDRVRARVWAIALTLGTFVPLTWMLIGAPWTGLERSQGLTLRYILPLFALLPVLSIAGCFPLMMPWYRRLPALAGGIRVTRPLVHLAAVVAGGALVWHVNRQAQQWLGREDARLVDQVRLAREHSDINNWKAPLPAVLEAEAARGIACESRRFFSVVRFDEPLALQPPGFGAQVFYAGRDPDANRRAGPIGRCDYVIATPAVAGTDKGQALVRALAHDRAVTQIAATRDFVIFVAMF